MKIRWVMFLLVLCSNAAWAGSLEKAKVLYQHRLPLDAKREAIDIVFDKASTKADKAGALDLLASIDVDENNFKSAFDTWTKLVKEYPESPEAKKIADKLKTLQEVVSKLSEETITDSIARSYLKNADFWAGDRAKIFKLDNSWIPAVDAALFWYDLVIKDFAGTDAARVAYEEKLRTIQGWEDKYDKEGIRGDFKKWMPIMEKTFRDFEAAFPSAGTLQAFRYQIAQEYWKARDWTNTRKWLQEIIDKSSGNSSFYKDLAERRLKKVEY